MTKKHNLCDIVYIDPANLYVDPDDIVRGVQRDPLDRLSWLIKTYGEHGEKFNPELLGVLIVKKRGDGKYAIKAGGGRHYGYYHLGHCTDPLPCIVAEEGDDLSLFIGEDTRVRVPEGLRFWGLGSDPDRKYEYRIRTIMEQTLEGFTTVPGKPGAVRPNNAIFAYDLGKLTEMLTLANRYWAGKKRRLEGIGLAGLAGFLALYPSHDSRRLALVLSSVSYQTLKDTARQFLPRNKEHQRQWGIAICKELVTRYNNGIRSVERLSLDKIATLQARLQKHPNFKLHGQVWEMRKIVGGALQDKIRSKGRTSLKGNTTKPRDKRP